MDSLAFQGEALLPLVAWTRKTHTFCSDTWREMGKAGGKMCQRGWSCSLTHCFINGGSEAWKRWELPLGPNRLVAKPVQGSLSYKLHSMLFLYLIHPIPPRLLEVISPWHQQVLDLGTNTCKMVSAMIRGFSEMARD